MRTKNNNPKDHIKLEQITLSELHTILLKQQVKENDNRFVEHFDILSKYTGTNRPKIYSTKYTNAKNLKEFEKQEEEKYYDSDYDINIIATNNNVFCGIFSMMWIPKKIKNEEVWQYYSRFIDIKEDNQDKGIATKLLSFVEKLPEVQGKILRFGNYEGNGEKYLNHKIREIFNNNKYYIIPKESWKFNEFPKEFGCYLQKEIKK